jgi:hypothetical protein
MDRSRREALGIRQQAGTARSSRSIFRDCKYHRPVGAFEIIPEGAFEQAADLIGVVAERTSIESFFFLLLSRD